MYYFPCRDTPWRVPSKTKWNIPVDCKMLKRRKHIRLRNFDYSSKGAYFITICTKDRENFFGKIKNDEMILNSIGKIAYECLINIPDHFSHAEMDVFIVMPNHIHCILFLDKSVGASHGMPHNGVPLQPIPQYNQFSKPVAGSVSVIINQFKSSVKRWCNKNDHKYFQWQSRFHDHVIRNENEYKQIKQYIINNPANWNTDKFFM